MSTAVITGASSGIGHALIERYADEGWTVLAIGNKDGDRTALEGLANNYSESITTIYADLREAASIEKAINLVGDQDIDLLINVAAVNGGDEGMLSSFGNVDFGYWPDVFAVNVTAGFHLAQGLLSNLVAGTDPKLMFVSSTIGTVIFPGGSPDVPGAAKGETGVSGYAYRSSKAALNFLGTQLALDLAPLGITVGMLCPGQVKTGQGGPWATVTAEQSAGELYSVIENFDRGKSGCFINQHDEIVTPYSGPPLDQLWPQSTSEGAA